MTDEERARKLEHNPRFENALSVLKEAISVEGCDSTGVLGIAIATAVFGTMVGILEMKGVATAEESSEMFIVVVERMTENVKQTLRLASILGRP
jgi:hypothetical protein